MLQVIENDEIIPESAFLSPSSQTLDFGIVQSLDSLNLELMLYNIYKSHNEVLYKLLGRKIDIWENYYDRLIAKKLIMTKKFSLKNY